jgi:hypothetical protein
MYTKIITCQASLIYLRHYSNFNKSQCLFSFFWEHRKIHCKEKKNQPKVQTGAPTANPRKRKTNVIVAKVSPSKTPENNPMKYISREKHHVGPDEEFPPHFISMVATLFSSLPFPWFGIKIFLSQLTRNSYAGNKESDP